MQRRFFILFLGLLAVIFCLTAAAEAAETPFADVAADHPYGADIAYVYEKGLFAGTGAGTFSPEAPMERGMLAAVLYRAAGSPAVPAGSAFEDVAEDAYYADAVRWAADRGLLAGTAAGTFSPAQDVTQEQLAALFYRWGVLYRGADAANADPDRVAVCKMTRDYARKAVAWCVSHRLVDAADFNPGAAATRAQAAALLCRLDREPLATTGYGPTLEALLADETVQSLSAVYCPLEDGGDEALLVTYAKDWSTQQAAVYGLEGGKAVPLLQEELCFLAGGRWGTLGVVEQAGQRRVCAHYSDTEVDSETRSREEGVYTLYDLAGGRLTEAETVQYSRTDENGTVAEASALRLWDNLAEPLDAEACRIWTAGLRWLAAT